MQPFTPLLILVLVGTVFASEYTGRAALRVDSASLTNGYDPWRSTAARIAVAHQRIVGVGFFKEQLERYNEKDTRNGLSAWLNIGRRLGWSGEYVRADEGVTVPETATTNRIALSLFRGWRIAVGHTDNRYAAGAETTSRSGELIRYAGAYRIAYTHYRSDVKDAGSAASDRLSLHRFLHDGFIAASYAKGRELEALPGNRILEQDVLTLSLFGEYGLTPAWGIEYSYEYVEQGDIYLRNGVGFGIFYRF